MAKRVTTKLDLVHKHKVFTRFMSVFKSEVKLNAAECSKEIAKSMAQEAVDILEDQIYNWEPLTEKYLDYKIKHGYDPRVLIKTGEYKDSISWGVTHGKVWCGIPSRLIHQGSGMLMTKLARIHEFGTATIPARPLWRPLLSKYLRLRPEFAKKYRQAIARKSMKVR